MTSKLATRSFINPLLHPAHWGRQLWLTLISMRFAVWVLLVIAVASIIGTVLPQQAGNAHYLREFGPFWYRVFGALDFYDVYHSAWYIGLVAFLVLSTTSCVIRNTPRMLRETFQRKGPAGDPFLRSRSWVQEWSLMGAAQSLERLRQLLRQKGYHLREVERADGSLLTLAERGRYYRLGYIFTHVAIILFCLGAFYNANVPLKLAEWTGQVHPEKNFGLPLSQVPQHSWLPASEAAFRGMVTIPVGQTADAMFQLMGDGFMVQRLPFLVKLDHFTVTHYRNGTAKAFISEVSVYGPHHQLLKTGPVQVNHPLQVQGVDIYQTSYNPNLSHLSFVSRSLLNPTLKPVHFEAKVGQRLHAGDGSYTLTVEALTLSNFIPRQAVGLHPDGDHDMIDMGPIVRYRVVHDGQTVVCKSYLRPFQRGDGAFHLLAFRQQGEQHYRYLAIPEGPRGGERLFLNYLATLEQAANAGSQASRAVFVQALEQAEASEGSLPDTWDQGRFLRASLAVLPVLHDYPLPFLVGLTHLQVHWSAGLEITKYPGMWVVHGACMLLVIGIFILFYVPRRRVWLRWRRPEDGSSTSLLMAGDISRHPETLARELDVLIQEWREGDPSRRSPKGKE